MTINYTREEMRQLIVERTADLFMAVKERESANKIEHLAQAIMMWAGALRVTEDAVRAYGEKYQTQGVPNDGTG